MRRRPRDEQRDRESQSWKESQKEGGRKGEKIYIESNIFILYIYMHKTLLNFGQPCSNYFWSCMRARGSASVHYKIALHFQLLVWYQEMNHTALEEYCHFSPWSNLNSLSNTIATVTFNILHDLSC